MVKSPRRARQRNTPRTPKGTQAPRAGGPSAGRPFAVTPTPVAAKWLWISLGVAVAVSLAVMGDSLRAQYVMWDDLDFMDGSPFARLGFLKALWLILIGNAYPMNANYRVFQAFWWFDVVLFRRNPFFSHLLNLLLHAANVALFWQCVRLLLARATSLSGRQILIAATVGATLFGIHPLNVEPVAWVSGRKVELAFLFSLSAFLLLLSRRGGWRRYVLAVLCYALAVSSNASAFGLPLVFGAWWVIVERKAFWKGLLWVLPFFLLVAWAGKMRFEKHTPEKEVVANKGMWTSRLTVGFSALARETIDLAYPKYLVPVYPSAKGEGWRDFWTWDSTLGLFLVLVSGVAIVFAWVRGSPLQRMLALGLAWYWLALSPTFVHHHAQADRHMYSSAVGLFMSLGIGVALAFERLGRPGKVLLVAGVCAALFALSIVAIRQTMRWRNTKTLFTHIVAATENNHVAQCNLGSLLVSEGKFDEGIALFRAALDYVPDYGLGHYVLAGALVEKGELDEAIGHYQRAILFSPKDPKPLNDLGSILNGLGRREEAEQLFRRAIQMEPSYADAHQNLGIVLLSGGKDDEAILEFKKAIELRPDYAEAHQNLGVALFRKGQIDEASDRFGEALRCDPNLREAGRNTAVIYEQRGQIDEAMRVYADLVKTAPEFVEGYLGLARVQGQRGNDEEAIRNYEKALSILESQQGKEETASRLRETIESLRAETTAPMDNRDDAHADEP
ncbi:tetratricopeptide repeat protein [Candidatus Sumerlaeota bacterium]|nr:tetratricopeptide repeat protein [Candidatus Sumerlaeota bacterium]